MQTIVKNNLVESLRAMAKTPASEYHLRAAIYLEAREEIAKNSADVMSVLAANNLGSLAGDLITQRALDTLFLDFPVLGAIVTDFSDEQAYQGQPIKTRITEIPAVSTLSNVIGWSSSDANTTDVSLTIGQPVGVQIEYNSTELASTGRDLFAEQVEACHYALGKNLVDALYAVITAANFPYATIKPTASVARADFVAMEKTMAMRSAHGARHALVNSDIYERLSNDGTMVSLSTQSDGRLITESAVPPIAGFKIIRAVNLPTTGNLTGFGFRKEALVLATRLPEDYSRALPPEARNGVTSVIKNPTTGMSVQKTDFVDNKLARAYSRIAIAYAVGKGNSLAGQRLVSA